MDVEFDPCPNFPGRVYVIRYGVRLGSILRLRREWAVKVDGLPCQETSHGLPYEPMVRTKKEAVETLVETHQRLVEALEAMGFTLDDKAALNAFQRQLAATVALRRHSSCELTRI
jgi:hypothetical protein